MEALTKAKAREAPQGGAGPAFADLIEGTTPDAFFADYWERRPLHIQREVAGFHDRFLSRAAVETLIASGGLRYPAIQLTRDGRYIPPDAFAHNVAVGRDSLAGVPDQKRLAALYGAGATISMPFLHLAWKPLADLAAAIEAEFDHPVHTNAYLTPGGCPGFTPHYDTHEVFVLQIAGQKHWKVDAPPAPLPHHTQPFSAQPQRPTQRVMEVELNPGDLLYLPRGFVHSTATSRTSSLHVTLGITVFTWVELLADWLQTSKIYPRYRRALEPGFTKDPTALQRLKDELPKIISELQDLGDYDALIEAFAKRVRAGAMRPVDRFASEVMAETPPPGMPLGEHEESPLPLALNRVVLYARDVEATVAFYEKHFGFEVLRLPGDRIVELVAQGGGANIMVHAAAKSVKTGQVTVKLTFDAEDVSGFCAQSARNGLVFGPVHGANGYSYANAKDPCGNNISVSSRAYRKD